MLISQVAVLRCRFLRLALTNQIHEMRIRLVTQRDWGWSCVRWTPEVTPPSDACSIRLSCTDIVVYATSLIARSLRLLCKRVVLQTSGHCLCRECRMVLLDAHPRVGGMKTTKPSSTNSVAEFLKGLVAEPIKDLWTTSSRSQRSSGPQRNPYRKTSSETCGTDGSDPKGWRKEVRRSGQNSCRSVWTTDWRESRTTSPPPTQPCTWCIACRTRNWRLGLRRVTSIPRFPKGLWTDGSSTSGLRGGQKGPETSLRWSRSLTHRFQKKS